MNNKWQKTIMAFVIMGIFLMPFQLATQSEHEALPSLYIQKTTVMASNHQVDIRSQYDLNCRLLPGLGTVALNNFITLGNFVGVTETERIENTNLAGCMAEVTFLLWQASARIMETMGKFFDFFVYYSINSDTYRTQFVEKGWAAVRDIANIFFIIALLYIAIKTVLSLNTSNNKRLISIIVVVALLINFSLFITKVVVDASNIMARVFYSGIQPVDSSGNPLTEAGGEKSISTSLVSLYNPQNIITEAPYENGGTVTFIYVSLILLAITLYTAFIFFKIAFVFVARVASLWIAMIFAPLAFASHTIPELKNMPSFGWKDWLNTILKNAFLAPIFIFFLYLIAIFLNISSEISFDDPSLTIKAVMNSVIPFAITLILLVQAKNIAVDFSGEMGKKVLGAVSTVGAVAGGVALGATAFAGRAVIGRAGSALANSGKLKDLEASGSGWARATRSLGKFAAKGSFDVRQMKIAGKDLASATKLNLGQGKDTSFEKIKEKRSEKRIARAKEIGLDKGTPQEQVELERRELVLRDITVKNEKKLEEYERGVSEAREELRDAKDSGIATEIAKASADLKAAKKLKKDLVEKNVDPVHGKTLKEARGDVSNYKTDVRISVMNKGERYASEIAGLNNRTLNFFRTLGQHSGMGAKEDADKIRKMVEIKV